MGTFSQNLLISEPTPGDPAVKNAWGTVLDTNFSLIDSAITGVLALNVGGNVNVILTSVQGQPDQARNFTFVFSGALTGNIFVLWPSGLARNFRVINNTTGGFTLSCAVNNGSGSPAGLTYTVPQGATSYLASDGTNIGLFFNDGFLPTSGGTLIGDLTISHSGSTNLTVSGSAGQTRNLKFQSSGSSRWAWSVSNTAESGGNAGSDLNLQSFTDGGAFNANVMSITRSTGVVGFSQSPTMPTPIMGDNTTKGSTTAFVNRLIPVTAVGFGLSGTGSNQLVASVTINVPVQGNYLVTGSFVQTFGSPTTWSAGLNIDSTPIQSVNGVAAQAAVTIQGLATSVSTGNHTFKLFWNGANGQGAMTIGTISVVPTN